MTEPHSGGENQEKQLAETAKRLRAVALQYRDTEQLPKIISSGVDAAAQQILQLAESCGIPITRDEALTDILAKVPVGAVIPDESFRLVAEIVSFLYLCDQEWRSSTGVKK